MHDTLKTLSRAVAAKDITPVWTHFCIQDGTVSAFNGVLYMTGHVPELAGLDCTVPAGKLRAALAPCVDGFSIKLTPKRRLSVKSGAFKALLNTGESEAFPLMDVTKKTSLFEWDIRKVLYILRDFLSKESPNAWAKGTLLRDGYAYATNNVVIARTPIKWDGPDIILPAALSAEILKEAEAPLEYACDEASFLVTYGNGVTLWSKLVNDVWPDVSNLLKPEKCFDFGKTFSPDILKLKAFSIEDTVHLQDGKLLVGDNEASIGGYPEGKGAFRIEHLCNVLKQTTHINFDAYPKPCYFEGDNIEGVIIGMREK